MNILYHPTTDLRYQHLYVGIKIIRAHLTIGHRELFMKVQISDPDIIIETLVNCLECQHLYRPNPNEDHYLCLRTLEEIFHELDENMTCLKFEVIQSSWKPVYIEEIQNLI